MYTSNDFPGYGKFCFPALNIVCVNRKIQSAARYSWFVLCMKSCSLKADCRHGVWIREKKIFIVLCKYRAIFTEILSLLTKR